MKVNDIGSQHTDYSLDVRQRIIAQYSSYNIIASGVTTMGNYLQFTTFKQNRNLKIKNLET